MNKKRSIPIEIKKRLIKFSQKLPTGQQGDFLSRTVERLENLAWENQNLILYTALGYIIGEILDNTLLVHLPIPLLDINISLTGDNASEMGMLLGLVVGFFRDQQEINMYKELQRDTMKIIIEELKRIQESN